MSIGWCICSNWSPLFFLWEDQFRFWPLDLCPLFIGCNHSINQGIGVFCSVMLTASVQKAACYTSYLANSDWKNVGMARVCYLMRLPINMDKQHQWHDQNSMEFWWNYTDGEKQKYRTASISAGHVKPQIIPNIIQGDSGGICNHLGNDSMCDSK
jgi:hypothetical protein